MQFPLTAGLFLDNEENSIVPYTNPQFRNNNQPFYRNGLKNLTKRTFSSADDTYITSNGKTLTIRGNEIFDINGKSLHKFDTLGIQSKTYYPDYIDISIDLGMKMKIENNGNLTIQYLNTDVIINTITPSSGSKIVTAFFIKNAPFIIYGERSLSTTFWYIIGIGSGNTKQTISPNINTLFNDPYGVMVGNMIYFLSEGTEGLYYFTYDSSRTGYTAARSKGKYLSRVQNYFMVVSDTGFAGLITGQPTADSPEGITWQGKTNVTEVIDSDQIATAPGLISFISYINDSTSGDVVSQQHYFNDKKQNISDLNFYQLQSVLLYSRVAPESIKRYPFIWNTSIDITPVNNTRGIVRILYNNSVMQAISYVSNYNEETDGTVGQGICTTRVGSLLIPFGSMDSNYPPEVNEADTTDDILFKDQNGVFCIIKIGTPEKRIIKIHDKLYKINTVSLKNIMYEDGDSLTFEFGSLDWNNRLYTNGYEYTNPTVNPILSPMAINSGYNSLYESNGGLYHSTSLNSGNINISLYFQSSNLNKESVLMSCLRGTSGSWVKNTNINSSYKLDVFFSFNTVPIYLMSANDTSNDYIIKPELKGTVYPTPDVSNISTPLPLYFTTEDTSNANSLVTVGYNQQAFLQQYKNYPMDNFYFSSILYRNYTSFTILGTYNYVYDGKYIFAMNRQGTITLNLTEVCKAYNYIFLGNSYTEAYFYNRFDKSIYIFAGDRRLSKMLDISNRPEPSTYKFSSSENQMYLMFPNEILIVSPLGQIYNHSIPANTYDSFIETNDGCWVHGNNDNFLLRLNPLPPIVTPSALSEELVEIYFETEYIGIDSQTLIDLQDIIIRLHTDHPYTEKGIAYGVETISSDSKDVDNKTINIQSSDWDYTGHLNIRIVPKYIRGLGHKLLFSCSTQLQVCSIEWNAIPVAKLPTQGKRSL